MNVLKSSDGTQWTAEDRPCPICGSGVARTLGARGGRAHHEGKGVETNVVRCKDCKVIYTQPTLIPKSNPYAKESAEEYFQLHDSDQKILQGERIAVFAEKVLGKPGRMLELGCGRGEFLKGALNRGWSAYGVEMTEDFTRVARSHGVEVEYSSIEHCKSLEQTYDVVLLAAILEHLYDPMETLGRIKNALRPGGLLFIDVPNESSLTMRIGNLYMRARGRNWAINLSPTFSPFHVVGFSPTSLRNTLSSVGFDIHTLNVPKWNNALPEGATIGQKIERLGLSVVQSVGALVGMGDGITCWAVRK
ncbi:MAG: class I SAM-dependent methyltransferase [Pyrinomonadaceae bacterium]